jgi:hypothetical protein
MFLESWFVVAIKNKEKDILAVASKSFLSFFIRR